MKMQDNGNVEEYISQAWEFNNKLSILSQHVEDSTIIQLILARLPQAI